MLCCSPRSSGEIILAIRDQRSHQFMCYHRGWAISTFCNTICWNCEEWDNVLLKKYFPSLLFISYVGQNHASHPIMSKLLNLGQSSRRWETARWWRWSSSGQAQRTRGQCRGRDTSSTHSSRLASPSHIREVIAKTMHLCQFSCV